MSTRTELVERFPWVTRLKKPHQCSEYRSGMSRKASNDPELSKKYECRNPAYWKFRALKKSWSEDGIYCWSHLISRGVHGDMDEDERTMKWLKKNCPELFKEYA